MYGHLDAMSDYVYAMNKHAIANVKSVIFELPT